MAVMAAHVPRPVYRPVFQVIILSLRDLMERPPVINDLILYAPELLIHKYNIFMHNYA